MGLSALAIALYVIFKWHWLLMSAMILGGLPMIYDVIRDLFRGDLGADALAAVAIITAFILKEYVAGTIIVLMLSGGAFLENYAVHSASSVLNALLKRMPKTAHRKAVLQFRISLSTKSKSGISWSSFRMKSRRRAINSAMLLA